MAKKKNIQHKETFADMLKKLQEDKVETKPVEIREEKRYFLIVCEGSRTEPLYFEHIQSFLPKDLLTTIVIDGGAGNTVDVVNKARQLRDKRAKSITAPAFDEAWAVFDKDDFPASRFNQAITQAKQHKIHTAETNEAFELWYVLHYEYLDTAIKRTDYIKRLTEILKKKYQKKDPEFPPQLFDGDRVRNAIKRAEQLCALHVDKTPASSCPYTMVHKLVEKLLNYVNHPCIQEKPVKKKSK